MLPFRTYLKAAVIVSIFGTANSYANDEPVAMITTFDGKVRFENSTDREVDFGTDIYLGDMLKTGPKANVTIAFYNGCRQETVDKDSIVQVGSSKSHIREGQFLKVENIDCQIPSAALDQGDSHLKAGLVVRAYVADKNKTANITENASVPQFIAENKFKVKVWSNKGNQPSYLEGEKVVIHFVSQQDAYVLMDYYSSDGNLYHLTPDLPLNSDGQAVAGSLYSLGQGGFNLTASKPYGTDWVKIIASNKPFADKFSNNKQTYIQQLKEHIQQNKQNGSFTEVMFPITIEKK